MLISAIQQSDSVMHIDTFILFYILFCYGLSQDIEYSSLCYTVGPCCLSMEAFFFFFFFKLINLFLAVLGLRCCAWAFSGCDERGLLFVAVRWLLIAVASLVVEHGL